jgi:hypothetical protein
MRAGSVTECIRQEIIHAALNDQLGGKVYDANKVSIPPYSLTVDTLHSCAV